MALWNIIERLLWKENKTGERAAQPAEQETAPCPGEGSVAVVHPACYAQVGKLADFLKTGYTLLLNLEGIPAQEQRRIVDFMSGCAYARDGKLIPVSAGTYLIAPSGVSLLDGEECESDTWEPLDQAFGF